MRVQPRQVIRLAVVGVMLLAVAILLGISVRQYFTVSESRLPDLVGMQFDEAARVLRRNHLEPVAFAEDAPGVAADTVTSQTPEPGTIVKHGRTISLGVNTPGAAVRVPDLVGMTQAQAVARAAEVHLVVPTVSFRFDTRPAGTVVAQEPEGGASLAFDQRLSLVVSQGPEPIEVELPDLTGMAIDAAVQQLTQLGFHLVQTAPSAVSFDEPRTVTGMRPEAGTSVATSTPVSLFYSLSALNVVQVPALGGMPLWRAQLALQAARLRVGRVTYVQEADKPEGVLTASPWAYTVPGTPIDLQVNGTPSTDPLPDLPAFANPDAGFRTPDDFGFATPGVDSSDTAPFDRTPGLGQPRTGAGSAGSDADTAAGPTPTTANPRTSADDAPLPPGGRRVPFTFDPRQMGVKRLLESPYELKLVVTDDRGERTLLDSEVEPGAVVSTSVVVFGDAPLLQTFIDGVFFQAWRP